MIASLRQLFRARGVAQVAMPLPGVPQGQRVYAVGDIHGRADLFAALIAAIDDDDRRRNRVRGAAAQTTVVLLGDLVDRGPDSARVLSLAQDWQSRRRVRILCGNHEEMLLESLTDLNILRAYLRCGGCETVLSFGIDQDAYAAATHEELQAWMADHIPGAVLEFIRSFEEQVQIGDYLFVHAGIRPGVAHDEQQRSDLLWIREPFLSHDGDHGAVVVHGHTICEQVTFRENRIGIDTGAYASGILTAIGLEGDQRWLIEASEGADGITISERLAGLREII
ncbi:MAG: serine/threonine protein phosphatase [Pseudomonadota bacterium]|nr:serine/threonine protein phosphatase [Pseudomonadota bacterium]